MVMLWCLSFHMNVSRLFISHLSVRVWFLYTVVRSVMPKSSFSFPTS